MSGVVLGLTSTSKLCPGRRGATGLIWLNPEHALRVNLRVNVLCSRSSSSQTGHAIDRSYRNTFLNQSGQDKGSGQELGQVYTTMQREPLIVIQAEQVRAWGGRGGGRLSSDGTLALQIYYPVHEGQQRVTALSASVPTTVP